MSNQLNYLNNLNKPNLVDISLLQKINDGYTYSQPKQSYLYSFVQTAGSATCGFAKDNLFIFLVIACLILFLMWCYIEKQRQNALYEKYLQKKLAKSLLSDELNLFTEVPEPINIEKLFTDINNTIIEEPEPVPVVVSKPVKYINKEVSPPIHLTKREQNQQINNAIQRIPEHQDIMGTNSQGSKYASVLNFNPNSYML
jgi:hypothetical protein